MSSRGRRRSGSATGLTPALGKALVGWFATHRRALPWRRDRDPYRIWVAEVLLQQTRVAQAAPYFGRFVARFPTVASLARAPLEDVLRVWQGAGYYARARHLWAAARELVERRGGRLPTTVPELEALPGIGPYVARAVASLAFDAPVVALEANGLRVAARCTLETGDVRRASVRSRLGAALATAVPPGRSAEFNEGLMELGETICRPAAPLCVRCPLRGHCRAYRETGDPASFPRRPPPVRRPHVRAALAVVRWGDRWLVQRRAPTGLLGGLWEFPGGKIAVGERPVDAARRELREETGLEVGRLVARGVVRHGYSHFTVELHVFEGTLDRARAPRGPRRWVTPAELGRLPIPKATEKVLALVGAEPGGTASRGSGSRPGRTRASPSGGPRGPRARSPARRTGSSASPRRARS